MNSDTKGDPKMDKIVSHEIRPVSKEIPKTYPLAYDHQAYEQWHSLQTKKLVKMDSTIQKAMAPPAEKSWFGSNDNLFMSQTMPGNGSVEDTSTTTLSRMPEISEIEEELFSVRPSVIRDEESQVFPAEGFFSVNAFLKVSTPEKDPMPCPITIPATKETIDGDIDMILVDSKPYTQSQCTTKFTQTIQSTPFKPKDITCESLRMANLLNHTNLLKDPFREIWMPKTEHEDPNERECWWKFDAPPAILPFSFDFPCGKELDMGLNFALAAENEQVGAVDGETKAGKTISVGKDVTPTKPKAKRPPKKKVVKVPADTGVEGTVKVEVKAENEEKPKPKKTKKKKEPTLVSSPETTNAPAQGTVERATLTSSGLQRNVRQDDMISSMKLESSQSCVGAMANPQTQPTPALNSVLPASSAPSLSTSMPTNSLTATATPSKLPATKKETPKKPRQPRKRKTKEEPSAIDQLASSIFMPPSQSTIPPVSTPSQSFITIPSGDVKSNGGAVLTSTLLETDALQKRRRVNHNGAYTKTASVTSPNSLPIGNVNSSPPKTNFSAQNSFVTPTKPNASPMWSSLSSSTSPVSKTPTLTQWLSSQTASSNSAARNSLLSFNADTDHMLSAEASIFAQQIQEKQQQLQAQIQRLHEVQQMTKLAQKRQSPPTQAPVQSSSPSMSSVLSSPTSRIAPTPASKMTTPSSSGGKTSKSNKSKPASTSSMPVIDSKPTLNTFAPIPATTLPSTSFTTSPITLNQLNTLIFAGSKIDPSAFLELTRSFSSAGQTLNTSGVTASASTPPSLSSMMMMTPTQSSNSANSLKDFGIWFP